MESAIERLVKHHGGPVATAQKIPGVPYQAIQVWLRRGWASPMHILKMEALLPAGMTLRELHEDRDRAKAADPAKAA